MTFPVIRSTMQDMSAATRYGALLLLLVLVPHTGHAYENELISILGSRFSHRFDNDMFAFLTLQTRYLDGFKTPERKIIEARTGKNIGNNQVALAYSLQFDRHFLNGNEHRLWQQFRHIVPLSSAELDFRIRVEERYFTASHKTGGRARLVAYWNKPLPNGNEIRLGNELVLNMNDYGTTAKRGFSQDRLLASFRHEMKNGNRLDLNYQYKYVHVPASANIIQHQVQMMLTFDL